MSEEIRKWLDELGLGQYADVFTEQEVVFEDLAELDDDDLKEIGIPLGPRKRILKAARPENASDGSNAPGADDSLSTWERHPNERKPATVLFADIVNSTALTEHLDPEDAYDILEGARQHMCAAIANNRGTLCRIMGDGVMAVFGAPMASETHALEACGAAIEMQKSIHDYADELEANHGSGLEIRVGLHSGEIVVIVGGDADRIEYDVEGPTVPLAARMEQTASPGEIYITKATLTLAGKSIEAKKLEPILVKGISDPVPVFALRALKSREEIARFVSGTRFVGRRSELGQFRGIIEACMENRQGETVYVRGEPGIGKTRLIDEFNRMSLEKGAVCHRAQVLDFGVGTGQDAIRALVRNLLGITSGSGRSERKQAADRAISDQWFEAGQRVYVNDLLDLPQPTELRALYDAMDNEIRNQGKQKVVSSLVIKASAEQPLMVVVEDIHWANRLTLAHISNLAKTVSNCAALLVVTSRVEGDPLDMAWRSTTQGSPLTTIDLSPLRKNESMALIGEFMDSDSSFAAECIERAGGNPLFLEQFLHNADEGSMESLPDSIQSLVMARVDRLSPAAKQALQSASVIGQRFSLECLRALLDQTDYDCDELIAEGLVRADGEDFYFTHALIRDGIYGSLLKRQRCALHAKAAGFFSDQDLGLRAEHLDRAGDPGAARAYLDSARLQISLYRTEVALMMIEKGLLLDPADSARYELTCLKGEQLQLQGQTEASIQAWREAVSYAQDGQQRCTALMGIATGLRLSTDYSNAMDALDEAEQALSGSTDPLIRSRLHNLRGNLYFPTAEIELCKNNHKLAMQYAMESGSDEARANALSGSADVAYLQGRMATAERFFGECVALCRKHGFGRIEVANFTMQAYTRVYLLELKEARSMMIEALDMARLVGNRRAEIMALRGMMTILRMSGHWKEMGEVVAQFQDLNKVTGMKAWNGFCAHSEAVYLFASGELAAAKKVAAEAVELDRKTAIHFNLVRALGTQVLMLEDPDETRSVLQEGEDYLRQGVMSHNYLWFYPDAVRSASRLEDWDLAKHYADALETYTAEEPLPWSIYYCTLARTMAELAADSEDRVALVQLSNLREQADTAGLDLDTRALNLVLEGLNEGKGLSFPDLADLVVA